MIRALFEIYLEIHSRWVLSLPPQYVKGVVWASEANKKYVRTKDPEREVGSHWKFEFVLIKSKIKQSKLDYVQDVCCNGAALANCSLILCPLMTYHENVMYYM